MQYAVFTSCLIGAFLVFHIFKKKGRHVTIVCILIGFGIAPVLGGILGKVFSLGGTLLFGLAVPVALSVFVVLWLYYVIKERKDHKFTPWIAFAAAAILVAGAHSGLPILQTLVDSGNSVMETGNQTVQQSGR